MVRNWSDGGGSPPSDQFHAYVDLPPGGLVPEDYVLQDDNGEVRLSDLFSPGHDTLVVYHYMFPRDPDDDRPGPASGESARLTPEQGPCPSCTALLDQLDGAVEHFSPHADFAVVARAPIGHLRTFAAERGWRRLRLFSCAGATFSRDYHGEAADGSPRPMLNVFRRDAAGIRHFGVRSYCTNRPNRARTRRRPKLVARPRG